MISAGVKTNIKQQQEIKDLVAVSYKFLEKKGLYFSFDFGWYSIHLILPVKNRGWGVAFPKKILYSVFTSFHLLFISCKCVVR